MTVGSLGSLGVAAVPDLARSAAGLGYRSFWTVEATGSDALTLLGAAAVAAPEMDLATGIMPIQLRPPSLVAMSAATLSALNPGAQVWVGLGVSAPAILRQHGVDADGAKPLAMMEEYVAMLRECWSGEAVTFEGDYWTLRRFRLGVRLGDQPPKIVLAALGPKMLRLAGRVADGVLLNYLPASWVASSVSHVRAGGDATIFCNVHAAVSDFERHAHLARRDLFNYVMSDGYANMMRAAGYDAEVTEARARFAERDREGALGAISERMIADIDFIGSAGEVTAFVRSYIDAGVEHPVVMALPWGDDRRAVTQATLEAAAAAV